ncbi:MAG: hypothetical protein ACM3VT_15425, partial [Solirubrobacterales bacterium]
MRAALSNCVLAAALLWFPSHAFLDVRIATGFNRLESETLPDEAVQSPGGIHKPGLGISLTLIPPSPVTDRIELDIRGSVRNDVDAARTFEVALYLDEEKPEQRLHQAALTIDPQS